MFMNEIVDIIDYLQKNRVPFALTGASAMAVWGYARASGDIDFVVTVEEKNYSKIKEFGKTRDLMLISDTPDQITFRDRETLFDYDFIFTTNTIIKAMYQNARTKRAFGKRFRVARPEDIVVTKLSRIVVSYNMEDAKDILVLATMMELDFDYICRWTKGHLELKLALEKVTKEADQYRYKNYDLRVGADRLSACL
ncbi:MAG: hypothetical protein GXO65_01375 [Euryarchaeota archaeon]|nr:hypothetical protein [Euryarchaeota archaeon]